MPAQNIDQIKLLLDAIHAEDVAKNAAKAVVS